LKDLFLAHDGLLISSPEYNSSLSAVLKNTIDWVSRSAKMSDGTPERPLQCFENKVVGLLAASGGMLGGIRGLVEVRRILGNIKCIVLPDQFALVKAHEAFEASGNLKDPKQDAAAKAVGAAVARTIQKLAS
jgi:NAD(P)H-dependent FMN reductase